VIHCCADHSVYDPASGARVLAGPAPQPLAAVLLDYDPATDELTALGTVGAEQFDAFFKKYEFKLAMEHGQAKAPIKLSFWTFENPQQRPWIHKRVKLYMEQNPHVTIDFQWFTFGDLGKKISVGFATGTAPDGFVSQDWFMPTWMDKSLLAPLDVQRLGYTSYDNFTGDFAEAFVKGATQDGKVYGYPLWFYGFCNYLNTKQFKEVGLDPDKDWPRDWKQFGEVAKRLTVKDGSKFTRQGFKFAMHAAQWTMIQFNPILITHGGRWFDASGKCTVNEEAGVKAMTARASIAKQYGAEDPADSSPPTRCRRWTGSRNAARCSGVIPSAARHQIAKREDAGGGYFKPCRIAASSLARASPPPTASI
jgi:ABC-type glycerol-3-phosphate transport system substrate-binding protein